MHLRTLGGLRLEGSAFSRPKPLLLLTYLALEGPKDRRFLSELFWPDAAAPLASLRTALVQLRQSAPGAVEVDGTRLRATVASDAQALLETPVPASAWDVDGPALGPSLDDLYPGPFLDGIYLPDWSSELEDWVYSTRELIAETLRGRLIDLAEALAARGEAQRAGRVAELAHRLPGAPDPAPETLERAYRLLAGGGSPLAAAVRREALDFGIELAAPAPPEARAPLPPASGLDLATTSFVGRDLELLELARLLGDPATRLVTLTGPGGTGKTRLAREVANQELRAGTFPDGVHLVPLGAVSQAGALRDVVAAALGLDAPESTADLAAGIGARRLLVVLDECEHLRGSLGVVTELLAACPGLTVLATSRERLDLSGEQLFPLDGLPVPEEGTPAERTEHLDSVRLFAQRAKRADLGFVLDERTLSHVARVCRLAAGSPLAIELAAALVRALPLPELAAELERSLDVLATRDSDVPDRHRSLRAAFQRSWDLLAPRERDALAALAVFADGFTREAAATVADVTIPTLVALVDKSLVRSHPDGRYDLHPLVRQYAREELARDPEREAAVLAAYAEHLTRLASRAAAEWNGPMREEWGRRIDAEHENIRSVLENALTSGDGGTALRLAAAVWFPWYSQGRWREARSWLERAVAAHGAADPDEGALADAALGIAVIADAQGDLEVARRSAERSLAISLRRGDRERVGTVLNHLGVAALDRGDFETAEKRLREALAVRRELGDDGGVAATLNNLGAMAGRRGDTREAKRYYAESLALFRRLGDGSAAAILLCNLGDVAEVEGDMVAAHDLYSESLELHRRLGDRPRVAAVLVRLAAVARRRGELRRARSLCVESLATMRDTGDVLGVAECLDELGMLLAQAGRPEDAAAAWGAMEALMDRTGTPLPPGQRAEHDEAVACARSGAEPAAFARAWERGRLFSLDEAVRFALATADAAAAGTRGR